MTKLPPTLQKYVDHIHKSGRPLSFTEIVSVTPGVNKFRLLRQKGLVKDITPNYTDDEEYTGQRESMYVLTPAGLECVSDRQYPEHEKMQKVRAESQAQGEFLEWLEEQQIRLCKYVADEPGFRASFQPVHCRKESLLAQYHGIDLKKIESEKQQMLDELRKGMK
jgi:hypothetical protein